MVFVSTFSHIKWTKAILIRTDNLLSSIPHPLLYQSIRLGYCTQIVAVVVVAAFFFNNSNQFQGNGFFSIVEKSYPLRVDIECIHNFVRKIVRLWL